MLTGRDILCISSIDWDFIWQGHQEIMSRLAHHGNRVLFVENTGVRAPTFRDVPRIRSRIRNWWRGTKGFREEQPNLFVFSPVVLPFPYSRIAQWINRVFLRTALRRWMRAADFHSPIVWTFLPTPLVRDLMRDLDSRLKIYYCIDDFSASSPAARRIVRSEEQVMREADLVFVTSEALRSRASCFNGHVHLFPFGVDYDAFEQARLANDDLPHELRGLPRPVVGYVGGLHQWVDQGLVCAVADAMPGASLALIGPHQTELAELRQRRNIHLFGARNHADLPKYIKGFDVGIVPYRHSEYTASVYPTKLNEYLAMGIPVVATDLLEIRHFNVRNGGVVTAVDGPEAFVNAVREAAYAVSDTAVQRRMDVARENSWTCRLEEMSALVERSLIERQIVPLRWDLKLTELYHAARRRMIQVAATLLVAYAVLFYTPTVWIGAHPLLMAAPPAAADAIVVFGAGVGESGYSDQGYQERVKQAVELYKAGFAHRAVFSSGFRYDFTEAEIMRTLAVSQGVASADIFLETRAASTRENVLFVKNILERQGWHRILLVSSPYHMRRAMLTWRKLAPDVVVIPTPVARSQFYEHRIGASLEQIEGIAYEYLAITYYWINGWI